MTLNVGVADMIIRLGVAAIAVVFVITGLIGFGLSYAPFGISTKGTEKPAH